MLEESTSHSESDSPSTFVRGRHPETTSLVGPRQPDCAALKTQLMRKALNHRQVKIKLNQGATGVISDQGHGVNEREVHVSLLERPHRDTKVVSQMKRAREAKIRYCPYEEYGASIAHWEIRARRVHTRA